MERVNELLEIYKYPLIIGLVGAVLIFSGSITTLFSSSNPAESPKALPQESLVTESNSLIKVDLSGAVQTPSIYELPKDSRVDDLLKAAGGFKADVNTEFVAKHLNLSQKLTDGQKIYIPFKGESISNPSVISTTQSNNRKVNINTSSQSELEELPGIGPSTASKIIAGRPFESLNDLVTKKVLGKALFEKIKDQVQL